MSQALGSKERTLFTQVVKNYESKQYKKGLKAAEQILRKNPTHGDTQAMKALILNSQGSTEEAFVLAKAALRNAMKSHVCWHVYGLLYRSVKNFEESIKAYKFALKLEPESPQIQRDLAMLQMQMRDYVGYVQSRRTMLQVRPALRSNWTALAIAQHLNGDLVEAERTLTTYEETVKVRPSKTDIEHHEAVLYKNMIIAETGETERALDHLEAVSKDAYDKQTVMEARAGYLLKLDRKSEAEKVYRALLERNLENRAYYEGLEAALDLDKSNTEELKKLYFEYAEKNARGDAPRRIPLDFLQGEAFRETVDQYLQRMLKKGVPSTFVNLKALYADDTKRDTIQELVEGYASGTRIPDAKQTENGKHINSEDDTVRFDTSVLYFLAQHYNYRRSRDLTKAVKAIEKATEKDPKSVDYYMTKARILKNYGNIQEASKVMEEARKLDERDRYINTKSAKYKLRNDENEAALETMKKFTRNEAVGGPLGDLLDMQCMWFLTEDGESFLRQKRLGLALKRFTSILNIFEVWQEDQFDFHSFSIRKGQIRAYIDMVRWEDHLREHPFFTRAAISATKAYILLHEKPHLAHGNLPNGVNGTSMDANERKKAARKAKKAQEKQEQVEAEKKDAKKTAGANPEGEQKKEDKDPEGRLLVQTAEPLNDAMKFVTPMLEFSPKSLEAQKACFEVFLRRKKYILALRCLLAIKSLSPDSATHHSQVFRLQHALTTLATPLPPKASEIIESELASFFPSSKPDLKSLNDDFLAKSKDAPSVIAALEVRYVLDPSSKEQTINDITKLLSQDFTQRTHAIQGLELLASWDVDTSSYTAAARKAWPEASAFQGKT